MNLKIKAILKETGKAELVETYRFGIVWIPKSAILDYSLVSNKIEIKRWFENKLELNRVGIDEKNIKREIPSELMDSPETSTK